MRWFREIKLQTTEIQLFRILLGKPILTAKIMFEQAEFQTWRSQSCLLLGCTIQPQNIRKELLFELCASSFLTG